MKWHLAVQVIKEGLQFYIPHSGNNTLLVFWVLIHLLIRQWCCTSIGLHDCNIHNFPNSASLLFELW